MPAVCRAPFSVLHTVKSFDCHNIFSRGSCSSRHLKTKETEVREKSQQNSNPHPALKPVPLMHLLQMRQLTPRGAGPGTGGDSELDRTQCQPCLPSELPPPPGRMEEASAGRVQGNVFILSLTRGQALRGRDKCPLTPEEFSEGPARGREEVASIKRR